MGFLVFVRHGQASFHDEDYDKLSAVGEEQARRLGEYWVRHGMTFDRVYTGPLSRQRRSAEIVRDVYAAAGAEFPPVEELESLAEMPVERLAKRFMPQLCSEDEQALLAMQRYMATDDKREKEKLFQKAFEKLMLKWADETYHDPEIETFRCFVDRVMKGIGSMTAGHANGQRVAAFTSGGPTAVAIHMALNTSFQTTLELVWQVRNASVTEFMYTQGRFTLCAFNHVAHLSDPSLWTYR
jgi:broad specificity phosphatase PhoE